MAVPVLTRLWWQLMMVEYKSKTTDGVVNESPATEMTVKGCCQGLYQQWWWLLLWWQSVEAAIVDHGSGTKWDKNYRKQFWLRWSWGCHGGREGSSWLWWHLCLHHCKFLLWVQYKCTILPLSVSTKTWREGAKQVEELATCWCKVATFP